MSEKYIPISEELIDEESFLTPEDYEREGINIEKENLVLLDNGFVVPAAKRESLESVEVLKNFRGDEEISYRTLDGKQFYINHDNSDMYKLPEKVKLIDSTPEKEIHYLKKSTLVRNVSGRYKKGFTDNISVVKRVLDEKGKWISMDGMKKYMALSDVHFSFESNGSRKEMCFGEGEVFLAPQGNEIKKSK